MKVEDKLKADLNSPDPLVLISTYATKKNRNRINIYTFVFIEQKILPNTAQFPKNRNSLKIFRSWIKMECEYDFSEIFYSGIRI